ncbi:hypothetical protein VNO77_16038 [Canavalia gladiata]|uniref:Uncharacterized protein n=1 Tax=Canavalia gladiata TaxID=3824 RepID=A0AAN9M0F3_CANGL
MSGILTTTEMLGEENVKSGQMQSCKRETTYSKLKISIIQICATLNNGIPQNSQILHTKLNTIKELTSNGQRDNAARIGGSRDSY